MFAVARLCAVLVIAAYLPCAAAQYAKKRTISKGPRAVALIQIATDGRARLLPVTIMVNGDFYDASAYKADPVPFALQPDTVYQGLKSGVPQGLFTIGGAGQANRNWFADGKWETQAQLDADKTKAAAEEAKKSQIGSDEAELGGPPRLTREPEKPDSASKPAQAPEAKPSAPENPPSKPKAEQTMQTGTDSVEAPDRPILRRQPVSETSHEQTKASPETAPLLGPFQYIVAVSDAAGPEPRPYTYKLKPEEEQAILKKMLPMASDEVKQRAAHLSSESGAPKSKKSVGPAPELQNVELRMFDVSTTNEGVAVLTATGTVPGDDKQYPVAVVARQDIYGDLHKIFAQVTDTRHLDILPQYDFIDVVDADGDGRAELLFRTTWDSGSAFSVYRVLGDRLWPLFEGKPGS